MIKEKKGQYTLLKEQLTMIVEPLTWDSDFFGFKIGKLALTSKQDFESIKENSTLDYELIYLFSESPISNLTCVDEKVEFEKQLDSSVDYDSSSVVVWQEGINNDLVELAILSSHSSRFKKDTRLNHKLNDLYTMWIEKSIEGILADYVLVAIENDSILGFLTLKMHDAYSKIGLVAVKDEAQGKGIGSHLMRKAFQLTIENEKNLIRVITQKENEGAMKYYAKNGFLIHKKEYIYHYWQ